MFKTFKGYWFVALVAAAVVMGSFAVTSPSGAETLSATGQKAPGPNAAGSFKASVKGKAKRCNGQTTTTCCAGLSYCTCLYAPGSSDSTHPTSCSSVPPR